MIQRVPRLRSTRPRRRRRRTCSTRTATAGRSAAATPSRRRCARRAALRPDGLVGLPAAERRRRGASGPTAASTSWSRSTTWSAQTSQITRTVIVSERRGSAREDVRAPPCPQGDQLHDPGRRAPATTGGPAEPRRSTISPTGRRRRLRRPGQVPADRRASSASAAARPSLRAAPRIRYESVARRRSASPSSRSTTSRRARAPRSAAAAGRKISRRARRTGVLSLPGVRRPRACARRPDRDPRHARAAPARAATGSARSASTTAGRSRPPASADRSSRCLQPGSRKPTKCR